eukprot:gene12546-15330_t
MSDRCSVDQVVAQIHQRVEDLCSFYELVSHVIIRYSQNKLAETLAIMLNPFLISDFHDPENAALYKAIIECQAAGEPIDPVTVGLWRPTLPSANGTLALAVDIARNVPSTANWKTDAKHVRERAILQQIVDAAYERPLSEIIALAQQATADLRDLDDDGQRDYYRASEFLPGVVDTIDSKFNETAPTGLSTGLKDLDALVRGGRPGNMIVVGGLTGSGKAILDDQGGTDHARPGIDGSVNLSNLDSGELDDDDWPKLTGAVNDLNQANLFVNDQAGMTMPLPAPRREACRAFR